MKTIEQKKILEGEKQGTAFCEVILTLGIGKLALGFKCIFDSNLPLVLH